MSTLISTRVKDPLLKAAGAITDSTDLTIADLLRLGLRMVVRDFQASGGVRVADHGEPRPVDKSLMKRSRKPLSVKGGRKG